MQGADDLLGMEDVVRTHPEFEELLVEQAHYVFIVVDSVQQHRLVPRGIPASTSLSQASFASLVSS